MTAPGNHARCRNPDDEFWVIAARNLERDAAGEFAEQRPLDLENALGMLDRRTPW